MAIGVSWWDEHGLKVPKPVRKIKDDDFHLIRVAAEKSEELQSIILQRPVDHAWIYITCWHNETTIAISNPEDSRLYVRAHEVFDSYTEAYDFWKDMSFNAVLYPHVANNIYNDEDNKMAESMDDKRFMEMHPNWNSYIVQPYNWSHDLEYWEKQRTA